MLLVACLTASACTIDDAENGSSFTPADETSTTVEPAQSVDDTGDTAPSDTAEPAAGVPLIPNARVVFVIDGDTIEADVDGIQETVRFIGIDTPEKTGGFRPAECYGDEATARMQQLLQPGDAIRLELDVEVRDRFERLLAYVYSPDGLLNELMVAEGYAAAFRFEPNTTLAERFEAAQRSAQEFDLGLWGQCGGPDVELAPSG